MIEKRELLWSMENATGEAIFTALQNHDADVVEAIELCHLPGFFRTLVFNHIFMLVIYYDACDDIKATLWKLTWRMPESMPLLSDLMGDPA